LHPALKATKPYLIKNSIQLDYKTHTNRDEWHKKTDNRKKQLSVLKKL